MVEADQYMAWKRDGSLSPSEYGVGAGSSKYCRPSTAVQKNSFSSYLLTRERPCSEGILKAISFTTMPLMTPRMGLSMLPTGLAWPPIA